MSGSPCSLPSLDFLQARFWGTAVPCTAVQSGFRPSCKALFKTQLSQIVSRISLQRRIGFLGSQQSSLRATRTQRSACQGLRLEHMHQKTCRLLSCSCCAERRPGPILRGRSPAQGTRYLGTMLFGDGAPLRDADRAGHCAPTRGKCPAPPPKNIGGPIMIQHYPHSGSGAVPLRERRRLTNWCSAGQGSKTDLVAWARAGGFGRQRLPTKHRSRPSAWHSRIARAGVVTSVLRW